MAFAAPVVLIVGLMLVWLAAVRLAARDRSLFIGAAASVTAIGAWFVVTHVTTLSLRLIPWDDYVFFERTPLFLAIVMLLGLCVERVRPRLKLAVSAILVIFVVYTLLEVTGPIALEVQAGKLSDEVDGPAEVCQSTGWSCGPAATAWALRLKGIPTTERECARLSATTPLHGTTTRGTVRAIHAHGLQADVTTRAPWERLITATKPALTDTYIGAGTAHIVVLLDANDRSITVGDPLYGEQAFPREDFEKVWMRTVIEIGD